MKSVEHVHQMQTKYFCAGGFTFFTVIVASIFFGSPFTLFTFSLAIDDQLSFSQRQGTFDAHNKIPLPAKCVVADCHSREV